MGTAENQNKLFMRMASKVKYICCTIPLTFGMLVTQFAMSCFSEMVLSSLDLFY